MAKTLIQYAQENKQAYINACNAVIGKGGTVPSGMPASELANAITNIPSDQALAWQTVESNAKRVTVPSGVLPMAQIKKIGGMSYKSNNILKLRTLNETQAGVTITTNPDGSYTLNGTLTPSSENNYEMPNFVFWEADKDFPYKAIKQGRTISIKFNCDDMSWYDSMTTQLWVSSAPMRYEGENPIGPELEAQIIGQKEVVYIPTGDNYFDRIEFFIDSLYSIPTFNNVTFSIMVNDGKTSLPYEPFFDGLRDSKTTSIVSKGANLIPYPYDKDEGYTETANGITFTHQKDGGISVVGIPTANTTYTVIAHPNKNILYSLEQGKPYCLNGGKDGVILLAHITPLEGEIQSTAWLDSRNGNSNSKTLPTGYGFYRIAMYIAARGTPINTVIYPMLNEGRTALPYSIYKLLADMQIPEAVQSLEGYGEGINADYYNYIEWRDGKCYFVRMVANGEILAEPIETDITDLMTFDNHIAVEGGGTVNFNNEYGYDIPNEISYLFNTAGG
jgi:hypothetical protein